MFLRQATPEDDGPQGASDAQEVREPVNDQERAIIKIAFAIADEGRSGGNAINRATTHAERLAEIETTVNAIDQLRHDLMVAIQDLHG